MANYNKLNYQNYEPDLRLANKAAEKITNELSVETGQNLISLRFLWDESEARYISVIAAPVSRNGNLMRLAEIEGRYFSAICSFSTLASTVTLWLEEVDYGHYHRYTHFLSKRNEVCDDCPSNVQRRAA